VENTRLYRRGENIQLQTRLLQQLLIFDRWSLQIKRLQNARHVNTDSFKSKEFTKQLQVSMVSVVAPP